MKNHRADNGIVGLGNNNSKVLPPRRLQSVNKGRVVKETGRQIIVEGTVSGYIEALSVTAWRIQKTIITAQDLIHVKKEIIGSESFELSDDEDVAEMGPIHPKTINSMIISSPSVVIGTEDDSASASKMIRIHTEHLYMHNISVLGEMEVLLGKKFYLQFRELEKKILKIKRRLKNILQDIEDDLEDVSIRVKRPGNESIQPRYNNFLKLLESHSDQKNIILPCLRDTLTNLSIVNYQPIMQRWEDKYTLTADYTENQSLLEALKNRLNLMTVDLTLEDLQAGAKIILRFGSKKHVLKGPQKDVSFRFRHKLIVDPETEKLVGTLENQ